MFGRSYSCIKYEEIPEAQVLPVLSSYGHFLCQPPGSSSFDCSYESIQVFVEF